MSFQTDKPESPTIRPPSEWRSLLVRLTRGCKWNRCRFCGIYTHLGEPDFSIRTLDEIKHDIDLLKLYRPSAETAFFGDADPLQAGVDTFIEAALYLRRVIPVKRLTCYARTSTLWKLKGATIRKLADAGLNRVHIGLESGDDEVLRFHRKGQSTKMIKESAVWLKEAGIEISYYVLLGLGGKDRWEQHISNTTQLVNEVDPEFVRLRRLWLYTNGSPAAGPECPLWKDIRAGKFIAQTPEGTILELKLFLELLDNVSTFITCDHANNYIQVSGKMMEDRDDMLAEINEFLSLPQSKRDAHYRAIGSQI